ncbi:MAG TPA: acyl carrier protein [Acetobacteraceae bacterium]|nr:acyl carrier protein [Acetobacteraceae bacterium]
MRHTRDTILAEVADVARQVFEDPTLELTMDTTSDDVPRWDSMNHITLVVECESRFDVRFETMAIEELRSVGELVRLIERKLALAAA